MCKEDTSLKKNKLRKLEKKRKAERQRRLPKKEPLAYQGNKYRTDKLVPVFFQTEVGIYESFVISEKKITDHDARRALEHLIHAIRSGEIAVPAQREPSECVGEEPKDNLITWNIRQHWDDYFKEEPFPGRDSLVGVLRTILGSIETWGNISPTSRGYLRYLEGFMGKLGVHCRQLPPDFELGMEDNADDLDEFEDEEEDDLLTAGRAWALNSNEDAGVFFRDLADEMIAAGEAEEVADTCQQLMGEAGKSQASDELAKLSLRAQQRLEPQPRLFNFLGRLIGR